MLSQQGVIQGIHDWEFTKGAVQLVLARLLTGFGPHGRPKTFYRVKQRLSIKMTEGNVGWDLELDIGAKCCGCKRSPVIKYVCRDYQQPPPGPQNPGSGGRAAGGQRPQVVDGQIDGRNLFLRRQQRKDGKSGRGVYQRGDRAAMNHAVVLRKFTANGEAQRGCSRLDAVDFNSQQPGKGNCFNRLFDTLTLRGSEFLGGHER